MPKYFVPGMGFRLRAEHKTPGKGEHPMMKKQTPPWIRFIEGNNEQPVVEQKTAPGAAQAPSGESQAGSPEQDDTTDYKAKYEAMKSHSREWEQKAKANLAAAKKLQEIEDAGKTELQKLQDSLAAKDAELKAARVESARMRIAAQHGLSAKDAELFLHGDADAMAAQAEALAKRTLKQDAEPKGLGVNPAQGRGATSSPVREDIIKRAQNL